MPSRSTGLQFLLVVTALFGAFFATLPARAGDALDTSRLPRVSGSKLVYESAATTIVQAPGPVAITAQELQSQLRAVGWQRYTSPFAMVAVEAGAETMTLKKGPHGLTVRIASAPAQANATMVNYVALPLAHDLPIPADGVDIKYDPDRPHLEVTTGEPFPLLHDQFRRELSGQGWSVFMPPDGAPPVAGDGASERMFFVRDQRRPLLLLLRKRDDGKTLVKLESVPRQLLPGTQPPPKPAPPVAAAPEPSANVQFDPLVGQILKQALDPMVLRPAAPPPSAAAGAPLKVLAGNTASLPLPESAEDVETDGDAGTLAFQSRSSVKAIATFFRAELKRQRWVEQPSVIDRSNMVVLNFSRERKSVSLTIMQMGDTAKVTATGSALVARTTTAAAAPLKADRQSPSAISVDPLLGVADIGGLPVPVPNNAVGSTRSMFRVEAMAAVPASVPAVLDFYRRELSVRGWTEAPGGKVANDRADVVFATAEGPARLQMVRKGDGTDVSLLLLKEVEARKSGLMPRPGQVRLLFGSMLEADSTVVIASQILKVRAGVGQKLPDGPKVEIKPGRHKIVVRIPGREPFTEEISVSAGEIWGFLLGPGGGLALQAY